MRISLWQQLREVWGKAWHIFKTDPVLFLRAVWWSIPPRWGLNPLEECEDENSREEYDD